MPDPFPYIKVSGSAHECGVKYGKALRSRFSITWTTTSASGVESAG